MISIRKSKGKRKVSSKKKFNRTIATIIGLFLIFSIIIFLIYSPRNSKVTYGVTFSKPFAEYLELDWKETYLALLDDLEVKKIRLPVYWTEIENKQGEYYFKDIDWQIEEAQKRGAEIIFVVGQKQPRWPECHIPSWVGTLNKKEKEGEIRETLTTVMNRYKDNSTITAWQVENEPFLPYGECPEITVELLDMEIATVRELDPSRPVIITDSGELSTWYDAASRADILGTTLYRIVWNDTIGYVHYPISSLFYRLKAAFIMYFTNVSKIIIVELQAEPWGPNNITNMSLEEQYQSMSAGQFRKNIEFVKDVEFSEAYLWGGEWWYWLKTVKGDDSLWEEARQIF
ncbi:MAG: cellulase family glycosylhydrolase [Candidatus Pacebacteria bacterium]|nr:cellulase family glycosylhydrolase [Candidatus Paceibacterota bacterium]